MDSSKVYSKYVPIYGKFSKFKGVLLISCKKNQKFVNPHGPYLDPKILIISKTPLLKSSLCLFKDEILIFYK